MSCALIDMYSRCGTIDTARRVFEEAGERDTVVWNSMIAGYSRKGIADESMRLFSRMATVGVQADLATWNSVISGSSSCGALKLAKYLFGSMKLHEFEPDVFSWTSIISGMVRDFQGKEAFGVFREMIAVGVRPSSVTISCLLPACGLLADEKRGAALHACAVLAGVEEDLFVSGALVDMYCKCGFLEEAAKMFDEMPDRSIVSWNSMIFGHANNGTISEALSLYNRMKEDGVEPDHLTFTAVLMACGHGGLVERGMAFFGAMQEEHGIEPRVEHYACLVDLLGRAGHVLKAWELIKEMPLMPNFFVWGALLGACRTHGNVEIAAVAASRLLKLRAERQGSCRTMSNVFAGSGRWEEAVRMRMMAKSQRMRSIPGCSWIGSG